MGVVRSFNPVEGGPAVWVDGPIDDSGLVLRFARQLDDFPAGDGPVEIVVASGGGEVDLGLKLHALIQAHPRRTRVTILRAGSMAAVVAMAGAERRIAKGGTLFLHGTGFSGSQVLQAFDVAGHHTAPTLRTMARRCEAADAVTVAIFAARTGPRPCRGAPAPGCRDDDRRRRRAAARLRSRDRGGVRMTPAASATST